MDDRLTAIDAFCGAGGLSLGLHEAGFNVVAAFDLNEPAVQTYQTNLGSAGFLSDAKNITGEHLIHRCQLHNGLDLLAGGPPCQGFSKQKRGAHLGDDRNGLVLEFVRLVRELEPRFFLLENVDQLGGVRGKSFVSRLQRELGNYVLYPQFYNCADFGLAPNPCSIRHRRKACISP